MKEELDLDNIPLDRLGFDTPQLREERINSYMQEIETVIQSSCDSVPELRKFKSIMNNFFIGKVELTDRGIYIPEAFNLTEENAEEVYEVVQNYIDYQFVFILLFLWKLCIRWYRFWGKTLVSHLKESYNLCYELSSYD